MNPLVIVTVGLFLYTNASWCMALLMMASMVVFFAVNLITRQVAKDDNDAISVAKKCVPGWLEVADTDFHTMNFSGWSGDRLVKVAYTGTIQTGMKCRAVAVKRRPNRAKKPKWMPKDYDQSLQSEAKKLSVLSDMKLTPELYLYGHLDVFVQRWGGDSLCTLSQAKAFRRHGISTRDIMKLLVNYHKLPADHFKTAVFLKYNELEPAFSTVGRRKVVMHGDFHPGNVLVNDDANGDFKVQTIDAAYTEVGNVAHEFGRIRMLMYEGNWHPGWGPYGEGWFGFGWGPSMRPYWRKGSKMKWQLPPSARKATVLPLLRTFVTEYLEELLSDAEHTAEDLRLLQKTTADDLLLDIEFDRIRHPRKWEDSRCDVNIEGASEELESQVKSEAAVFALEVHRSPELRAAVLEHGFLEHPRMQGILAKARTNADQGKNKTNCSRPAWGKSRLG